MEQNFSYKNLPVRLITDNDEQTWFAGVDVCNILGYAMPSNVMKDMLDDDERKLTNVLDGSGQSRKTWTINESGLYSLILRSSKPEAKAFRKWITSEVLPAIRKAGKYTSEQEKEYEVYIQVLGKDIESLENELKASKNGISDLKSKLTKKKADLFKALQRDRSQLSIPFPKKISH